MKNLICIVLAAGKGTRFKSSKAKVLHLFGGKSLLFRTLNAVAKAGIQRTIVVCGHQKKIVEKEIASIGNDVLDGMKISIAHQKEQMGTGHAVQIAVKKTQNLRGDILILPGDIPLISANKLSDFLLSARKPPTKSGISVLTCLEENPHACGRIIRDENGNLQAIVEQEDANLQQQEIKEINSSVYLIDSDVLISSIDKLGNNNAKGEFYLTDIVEIYKSAGGEPRAICSEDFLNWRGANTLWQLAELERKHHLYIVQKAALSGVRFQDPQRVIIDEDVQFGQDVFIGADVCLEGACEIQDKVEILGPTKVIDSIIGRESKVRFGCEIEKSKIGSKCIVGPLAHLRSETELEDGVQIGNFVEVKKSLIHSDAKVNHLSYIGDARIGENANIGAGTITCNYDGYKKSLTVIGQSAFVGSNASLVAPVIIGDKAIIGAGSVITKDVSAGSLGISRSKQKEIHGHAEKKHQKKGRGE